MMSWFDDAVAGSSANRLPCRCWRCFVHCACATALRCAPIRTSSVKICCPRETCCCKLVWLIRSPGTRVNVLAKRDNTVNDLLMLFISFFLGMLNFCWGKCLLMHNDQFFVLLKSTLFERVSKKHFQLLYLTFGHTMRTTSLLLFFSSKIFQNQICQKAKPKPNWLLIENHFISSP